MSGFRRWVAARRLSGCEGQTMVDFALMVPIISLLVMGAVDFSVAVGRSAQLTSAVQEGVAQARLTPADLPSTGLTAIRNHVKKEGSGLNLSDENITVTCFQGLTTTTKNCSTAAFGDSVRVEATYYFVPITGRLISISGNPLAITQSATSEIY